MTDASKREKRPQSNADNSRGWHPITFEGRQLLCPYRDPAKIAAWLTEWRNDPAIQLAEMRARLAYLKQQARRVAAGKETRRA